jgi:hypothetical protein
MVYGIWHALVSGACVFTCIPMQLRTRRAFLPSAQVQMSCEILIFLLVAFCVFVCIWIYQGWRLEQRQPGHFIDTDTSWRWISRARRVRKFRHNERSFRVRLPYQIRVRILSKHKLPYIKQWGYMTQSESGYHIKFESESCPNINYPISSNEGTWHNPSQATISNSSQNLVQI